MGSYAEGREYGRHRDRDEGEYRGRERWEGRDTERDRQDWGREWGGQGFSGREGGWGGYGNYDRERGRGREAAGDERDRGFGPNVWRGPEGYGGGYGQEGWRERWGERGRGRYTGLGPRNWRRSDDRITEDINERLTQHPDVDASDIELKVEDGEVTLRGHVEDRRTKRLAEDIAEDVSGVRDVHNEIKIQRSEERERGGRRQEHRETTSAAHSGATAGTGTGTGSNSGNVSQRGVSEKETTGSKK